MAFLFIPMNNLKNIDRFYYYLIALLAVLAVLIIMILKTIFGAISTATSLDTELLEASTPKLDRAAVNQAYENIGNNLVSSLDLRQ